MKTAKKLLSILLSLLMIISAIPMTVYANDAVAYIDRSWDRETVIDTTKTVTDYELVTAETTTMSAGTFYVVSGDVTISNRIVIEGTTDAPTSIILTDGCTFRATSGIQLHSGKALNIYGQADDTGKLRATIGTIGYAGIGGNQSASSGSLTVYGGDVYAKGYTNAAGIGGGWGGNADSFTMYGGTVEADAYNTNTVGIGKGRQASSDGEFIVYCDATIVAGDSAPGTETTVDDYKNSRKKYVKIVSSNGIIHDYTDATCTEPKTCKSCGETFGAPLGHSYTIQGELISEATCSKADVYVYKCERCDSTTQKEGAMLDHTFVDGVCTVCEIEEFVIDENGVLIKYNGNGGDVVIPDDVTKIGMKVFFDCQALKSVTIPNGVKYIDYDAFARCLNLTDVVLTEGLNIIELSAFGDCSNLTNIVIPKSVTFISNLVFSGCKQLSSITISDNIETFGFDVFYGCSKLRTINYYCDSDLEKVKEILQSYDNGFNYNLVHDMLPATCTASKTCNACGTTEGKPLGHNWQKATCTEPKTCLRCAEIDGEPNGHNYLEYGIVTTETCTDPAYYEGVCTICGDYSDSIPEGEPLGHAYATEGALISRATCTEPAVYEAKCVRCGDISGTKTLGNPLGHNYKIIEKVSGNIYKAKCTTCGDVINDYEAQSSDYINATDLKKGDIIKAGTIVRVDSYYVDFLVDIDNQAQSVKNNEFIAPTCLKCTNKYVSEKYASAELSFTPACEYAYANCVSPEKCIYCGATTGDIAPDAHSIKLTVEDNVFTYTCSFGCGLSYTVDKTALFASIATAKNDYISATYYVSTKALQNVVTTAQEVLDSETATQDDVDDAVVSIETAINNLELVKYSVTVNKIVDGDTVDIENVSVAYGEMFNYFVELDENQAIYKWVMETDERDVKLNTITQDLSQVITGDVTFNCYIDNSDTKVEDTARVVFYDKGNRVIKLDYVAIGSSINYNVEAPKVAFYTFTGWETVSGDPTNVDKSGVSLRAIYAPKDIAANKSTVVALGNVKVNGKQTTTEFYDAKITLTGADSYAYCDAEGNILQGINGNIIYAPNNAQTIYVCAGTSSNASTSITGLIDEGNRLTINAQYYLPSGCTVVEAGVVISKTNENPTINDAGCQALKSSQQGSSGEYSISLKYSTTGTINAVSYLTYKDNDGALHTAYSDSQAITFGA